MVRLILRVEICPCVRDAGWLDRYLTGALHYFCEGCDMWKTFLVFKRAKKGLVLSSVISAALCNYARKVDWWAKTWKYSNISGNIAYRYVCVYVCIY